MRHTPMSAPADSTSKTWGNLVGSWWPVAFFAIGAAYLLTTKLTANITIGGSRFGTADAVFSTMALLGLLEAARRQALRLVRSVWSDLGLDSPEKRDRIYVVASMSLYTVTENVLVGYGIYHKAGGFSLLCIIIPVLAAALMGFLIIAVAIGLNDRQRFQVTSYKQIPGWVVTNWDIVIGIIAIVLVIRFMSVEYIQTALAAELARDASKTNDFSVFGWLLAGGAVLIACFGERNIAEKRRLGLYETEGSTPSTGSVSQTGSRVDLGRVPSGALYAEIKKRKKPGGKPL